MSIGYAPSSLTQVLSSSAYAKMMELKERRDTIIKEVTQSITETYRGLIDGATTDYIRYNQEHINSEKGGSGEASPPR